MLELVVGLVIVPELEVEDVLDVDDVLELDVVGSCITDGNLHCNPPSLTHVPPRFVQSSNATPDEELELDVLEVLEVLPVELDVLPLELDVLDVLLVELVLDVLLLELDIVQ